MREWVFNALGLAGNLLMAHKHPKTIIYNVDSTLSLMPTSLSSPQSYLYQPSKLITDFKIT